MAVSTSTEVPSTGTPINIKGTSYGNTKLRLKYGDKTCDVCDVAVYDVAVPESISRPMGDSLQSISLASGAETNSYAVGVQNRLTNAESKEITCTVMPPNIIMAIYNNIEGSGSVTFNNMSETPTITVSDHLASSNISKSGCKLTTVGDPNGVQQTITVTYGGDTVTKNITVDNATNTKTITGNNDNIISVVNHSEIITLCDPNSDFTSEPPQGKPVRVIGKKTGKADLYLEYGGKETLLTENIYVCGVTGLGDIIYRPSDTSKITEIVSVNGASNNKKLKVGDIANVFEPLSISVGYENKDSKTKVYFENFPTIPIITLGNGMGSESLSSSGFTLVGKNPTDSSTSAPPSVKLEVSLRCNKNDTKFCVYNKPVTIVNENFIGTIDDPNSYTYTIKDEKIAKLI